MPDDRYKQVAVNCNPRRVQWAAFLRKKKATEEAEMSCMDEDLYIPSNIDICLLKYNSGNTLKNQGDLKFRNFPDVAFNV